MTTLPQTLLQGFSIFVEGVIRTYDWIPTNMECEIRHRFHVAWTSAYIAHGGDVNDPSAPPPNRGCTCGEHLDSYPPHSMPEDWSARSITTKEDAAVVGAGLYAMFSGLTMAWPTLDITEAKALFNAVRSFAVAVWTDLHEVAGLEVPELPDLGSAA